MTDAAIAELAPLVGTAAACAAVGRPRSTHYRGHRRSPPPAKPPARTRKRQPRALSPAERQAVLDVLHDERFVDQAPASVPNTVHRHSGIGLMTPADVHHGRSAEVIAARQAVLDGAWQTNPERFVRKRPQPPQLPPAAWINRPDKPKETTQ